MYNYTILIALGIVAFILVYLFSHLKDGENKGVNHFLLQIFILGFLLSIIVLIGKVAIDNQNVCSYNLKNETYNYACGCCSNNTFLINNYTYTLSCFGVATGCDSYDGDNASCLSHNCTYNETAGLCFGTPYACAFYDTVEECDSDGGCQYQLNYLSCEDSNKTTVLNGTTYNYAYECTSYAPKTAETFYTVITWLWRIIALYIFIYYFYELLKYFNLIKGR